MLRCRGNALRLGMCLKKPINLVIGVVDLLSFLLGFGAQMRVIFEAIGMPYTYEIAICLLNLVPGGALLDLENS